MQKETEMLERITLLEKELVDLRNEVQHLQKQISPQTVEPATVSKVVPPPEQAQRETPKITLPPQTTEPIAQKERRSLEETFTRLLPRIFMVILVLGVLWGLKLVNDYGFLSDSVKILAGFSLSIGLGLCAFLMENKQKGSRVVVLSLYGGMFIVGILTTAAGAILYEVLGLYFALIIALLYIIYGVAISYMKGNEALTALVVFTSLLLPYLLEYMAFNAVIIGVFVVLLFAVIQLVILKHQQHRALYIGMACSILALAIVSTFHDEQVQFFALALVLLYSVFIASFLCLVQQENKRHPALLFSFTVTILFAINTMLFQEDAMRSIALLLLLGILSVVSYIVFLRKRKILFDVVATLAGLVLLNLIAQLDLSWDITLLLLIIGAFAGLMLAVKHAIAFMKWMYSFIFSMLGLFVLLFVHVQPFLSIGHFTQLVVIVMLVLLYRKLLQSKALSTEKKWATLMREDVFPVLIYGAGLVYIFKLDSAYMPDSFTSYFVYTSIGILFAAIVITKPTIVGHFLPLIAGAVYGVAALQLFSTMWVEEQAVIVGLLVRLMFVGIFWAILVDIWKQGAIYKNYEQLLEPRTEVLYIAGGIVSIVALFSISSYLNFHELISWNVAVILNTVSIFVISCLLLFLAPKRGYQNLKLTGIGLLFFGIVKMIFFDLSALDLLIRSISFIIIGAIGLVVSNKLLAKEKDKE